LRPLLGRNPKSRHAIREGAKFAVVGLAGAVIVVAGADALHYGLGLGKYASVTISTVAGMVPNYAANRYWTFRQRLRHLSRRQTALFFVLNGAGILFQYACVAIVPVLPGRSDRLWYTAANIVGLGLAAAFRFWSYRRWVWNAPGAADDPHPAELQQAGPAPDRGDARASGARDSRGPR
jgi:putative flippase GtrA